MAKTKRPRLRAPSKPPILPRPPDIHIDHNVSMLQLRLIGRVIVAWGRVENELQDLIWRLLGLDIIDGRVITSRLDVRPKLEMIETFAPRRIKDEAILKRIFNIVDIVRNCQGDRNFIVHGQWGTMMPRRVPVAMSLKDDSSPSEVVMETFPEGRMRKIIHDLEYGVDQLARILHELPPSPDIPAPPPPKAPSSHPPNPLPRSTSKRRRQPKASPL